VGPQHQAARSRTAEKTHGEDEDVPDGAEGEAHERTRDPGVTPAGTVDEDRVPGTVPRALPRARRDASVLLPLRRDHAFTVPSPTSSVLVRLGKNVDEDQALRGMLTG
jgi:hypothetical protein